MRRNGDEEIRALERTANASRLESDIRAFERALDKAGLRRVVLIDYPEARFNAQAYLGKPVQISGKVDLGYGKLVDLDGRWGRVTDVGFGDPSVYASIPGDWRKFRSRTIYSWRWPLPPWANEVPHVVRMSVPRDYRVAGTLVPSVNDRRMAGFLRGDPEITRILGYTPGRRRPMRENSSDEEMRRLERLARRYAHEVFLDWDDLVRELELTDQLIYHDKKTQNTEVPEFVSNQSDEDASRWVNEHEQSEGVELDEEQRMAVRDLFYFAIESEWMPKKKLEGWIDTITGSINRWAERGLQSGVTERNLPSGHAIDHSIVEGKYLEESGVVFRIYPPFLTASVEAKYGYAGYEDDGRLLGDVTGIDVLDAWKNIQRSRGRNARGGYDWLDVSDFLDNYTPPSSRVLEKAIRKLNDIGWTKWPVSERRLVQKITKQQGWRLADLREALAQNVAHAIQSSLDHPEDSKKPLTDRDKKTAEKVLKKLA